MPRLRSFKRLVVEDFPSDYKELIKRLAQPVNEFTSQLQTIFNGGIDFENIAQEIKIVTFKTGSDSQPLNPIEFSTNLRHRINGISVIRTEITSILNSAAATVPAITWENIEFGISIKYISGLVADQDYRLTLLII